MEGKRTIGTIRLENISPLDRTLFLFVSNLSMY